MLAIHESATVEEAAQDLLDFALDARNWVTAPAAPDTDGPGGGAAYQRRVGPLRILASVDVTDDLEAKLRVAFRAPGLTPVKAADLLERFLAQRLPLTPNTEWQVEVDERRWIHFSRRYAGRCLEA